MNTSIEQPFIERLSGSLPLFSRQSHAYRFLCPYCQFTGRSSKGRKYSAAQAKGYLYKVGNAWNYKCHKCGVHQAFEKFLAEVSLQMHLEYVLVRDQLGTTGFQTNCPSLETLLKQRGVLPSLMPLHGGANPQDQLHRHGYPQDQQQFQHPPASEEPHLEPCQERVGGSPADASTPKVVTGLSAPSSVSAPSGTAPPVTRLPRLTPQQQAGHQSRLNHLVKQRQEQRRRRSGELW